MHHAPIQGQGVAKTPSTKQQVKNPAYRRQRISRPMQIVVPIQFWRGYMIYLKKNQRGCVIKKNNLKNLGKPRENPGKTQGKPRGGGVDL